MPIKRLVKIKIQSFLMLSIILFALPKYTKAQMNNDSLLHIIHTSTSETELMKAYNDYAFQLCRIKPDSAIYYAKQQLSIAAKQQDEKMLNSGYNILGLAYATKGIYGISIENFEKALEYNTTDGYVRAQMYHNMALTYRRMKNNTEALKSELDALKINDKDSLLTGVIYQTLCNIYRDLGDYKLAEDYIQKSINIFENISEGKKYNRIALLANSYDGYGNLMQMNEQLEKAVEMHKHAIELHDASGDIYNKAVSAENLGTDYYIMKQYDNAIASYINAKELMAELKSATDVGYELLNIASVYQEKSKFKEAMINADSAIALFLSTDADAYLIDGYKMKYELYDIQKQPVEALEYYKKYIDIRDSIDIAGQSAELLRLKEEYETTQKEQQIALLQKDNALKEGETAHQKLLRNIAITGGIAIVIIAFLLFNRFQIKQHAKELQMRNDIASDLHDDLGSTLSSIRMYSDIVNSQIKDKSPESIPLLQKMSSNSKEMIENMSDIVWAIKPANDSFRNIESRMLNFVTELCSAKNITLKMEKNNALDNLKIAMEQRKDLYLIFKEAVNNAVKYSACNQLKISFQKINTDLVMEIVDNGKGFFVNETQSGNGLGNMKRRATHQHGTLEIESAENKGTTVILKMPIP